MPKKHYFVNITINARGLLAIVKDNRKVNQLENAKKNCPYKARETRTTNEFTQLLYFIFPDCMRMWREI